MTRTTSRWIGWALAGVLLAACGGGGGGAAPPGGGTDNRTLEAVWVHGALAGDADPARLRIQSSLGSGAIGSDGSFDAQLLGGSPQLAIAVDDLQRVCWLGWLSTGRTTVDARSTAEVLAYFALGGPYLLGEARAVMHDQFRDGEAVAPLAQAITAGYAGGAACLDDLLAELQQELAALRAIVTPAGAHVRPAHGASGIDVDTSTEYELTIRNNYRRRALAWVDRMTATLEDGSEVDHDTQPIREIDISPTVAYSSVIGTIIDAIHGNYMWAPVASPPVPTVLVPADARDTTYRVSVLGLGSEAGDMPRLSPERQDRFTMLALETIFIDFMAPIIVNIVLPAKQGAIDEFLRSMGGNTGALQTFLGVLSSTVPQIMERARAGDIEGAIGAALNALTTSGPAQEASLEFMRQAILAFWDLPTASEFATAGKMFLQGLKIVDMIGTGLDSIKQVVDMSNSQFANIWDVTVTKAKITLTPDRLLLPTGESHDFRATVQDGAGRAFEYHWTCDLGTMRDTKGHAGTDFESSDSQVTYDGTDPGKATLTVEVLEAIGATRKRIGARAAAIEVRELVPTITPRRASLKPGDARNFMAHMEVGYDQTAQLFYRWSGGDERGSHDGSAFIGTRSTVRYTAASYGKDYLRCEVFTNVNGRMESLGTAEAEIRVEDEPTIIFGTYAAHAFITGTNSSSVYADVVFPETAGAASYALTGYGGFDPSYHQAGPIEKSVNATTWTHDRKSEIPAGEIWISLSGLFGSGPPGPKIEYMDGRFAAGWTWEIEIIK